jgi:hypothetical protein
MDNERLTDAADFLEDVFARTSPTEDGKNVRGSNE